MLLSCRCDFYIRRHSCVVYLNDAIVIHGPSCIFLYSLISSLKLSFADILPDEFVLLLQKGGWFHLIKSDSDVIKNMYVLGWHVYSC